MSGGGREAVLVATLAYIGIHWQYITIITAFRHLLFTYTDIHWHTLCKKLATSSPCLGLVNFHEVFHQPQPPLKEDETSKHAGANLLLGR